MPKPRQPFGQAFIVAFKGISYALRHERNMRFHLISTLLVFITAYSLNVSKSDYIWLSIAVTLVWVTELLNTAIEQLTNLAHPEFHPVAGRVKDLAAGAVLLASLFGVAVAIAVFFPYIFS